MNCPRCGKDTVSDGPPAVVDPYKGWLQCLNPECLAENIWVSPDGKKCKSLTPQPPIHK
jgi:hypothetical protein